MMKANKYEAASRLADRLIEGSIGQFELILRQIIKQAFIEGVKYSSEEEPNSNKDVSEV